MVESREQYDTGPLPAVDLEADADPGLIVSLSPAHPCQVLNLDGEPGEVCGRPADVGIVLGLDWSAIGICEDHARAVVRLYERQAAGDEAPTLPPDEAVIVQVRPALACAYCGAVAAAGLAWRGEQGDYQLIVLCQVCAHAAAAVYGGE